MNLCDRNEIQELLQRHGFRFSKSMGQNFLIESWVPEDIAAASGADRQTGGLEIGPGGRERWYPWNWTGGSIPCCGRLWRTLTTSPCWRGTP